MAETDKGFKITVKFIYLSLLILDNMVSNCHRSKSLITRFFVGIALAFWYNSKVSTLVISFTEKESYNWNLLSVFALDVSNRCVINEEEYWDVEIFNFFSRLQNRTNSIILAFSELQCDLLLMKVCYNSDLFFFSWKIFILSVDMIDSEMNFFRFWTC